MKRQGFSTGNIYDENFPISEIGECCALLTDDDCSDDNQNKLRARKLKERCSSCSGGCPRELRSGGSRNE